MKMLDKYLCHEPEAQEGETSRVVSQGEVAVEGGGALCQEAARLTSRLVLSSRAWQVLVMKTSNYS